MISLPNNGKWKRNGKRLYYSTVYPFTSKKLTDSLILDDVTHIHLRYDDNMDITNKINKYLFYM